MVAEAAALEAVALEVVTVEAVVLEEVAVAAAPAVADRELQQFFAFGIFLTNIQLTAHRTHDPTPTRAAHLALAVVLSQITAVGDTTVAALVALTQPAQLLAVLPHSRSSPSLLLLSGQGLGTALLTVTATVLRTVTTTCTNTTTLPPMRTRSVKFCAHARRTKFVDVSPTTT